MPETIPATNMNAIGDDLMAKLLRENEAAYEFRKRRHDAWDEIYELNRNKPKTNRLTQRQAVNIPLMRETLKTLHSKVDDPPKIDWKELSGDEYAERLLQEQWDMDTHDCNIDGVDAVDKKNVLAYGRGFKMLNWVNNRVKVTAHDVHDVLIDPMVDPQDIDSARYIIRTNIFRPLREVIADERYEKEGRDAVQDHVNSTHGQIMAGETEEQYTARLERMRNMGVTTDDAFGTFAAGDVMIRLTEHFTMLWDVKRQKFVRYVCTYANDSVLLRKKPLKEALGIDFWPFVTWADDQETDDFWSDGTGDLVLTPNKIVNVWFSQLVENRTLRNFGMYWYDSTVQDYIPQVFEPGQGRLLPAPGNPHETLMPVEISGLDDTMNAIDFVIKIVERGSAATAIDKGTSERSQITLGEVEMLVGKAMERTAAIAKAYRRSWEDLAMKWYGLMEANATTARTLTKFGTSGKAYPKVIYPGDWKTKAGYRALSRSSSEQDDEKTRTIQRLAYLKAQYPQNKALRRLSIGRELDIINFSPEEIREIEEEETQNMIEAPQQAMQAAPTTRAQPQPQMPPNV